MKFIFFIILLTSSVLSHRVILNVIDNEDGSIQVIGGFDTGETATGALIKIESLISGKILEKKRLPDESELKFKIPNEPYKVLLAAGRGHDVSKVGPEPLGGFTKELKAKIMTSNKTLKKTNTLTILWSICALFLSLILFFWIRNTNKLILSLKNRG